MSYTLNPTTGEYDPVIAIDNMSLFEAVMGCGATTTYPWYYDVTPNYRDGHARIGIDTGESTPTGAMLVAHGAITGGALRRTVLRLIKDDHPSITTIDWSDPNVDGDIDAEIGDVILQTALLGRVCVV